jgi:hypothetical protein
MLLTCDTAHMKLRLLATLAVACVAGFCAPLQYSFEPYGIWPLCLAGISPEPGACAGISASSAAYMISVKGNSQQAIGYQYSILLTMKDGTTQTLSGISQRDDNSNGYTAIYLYPNGIVFAFKMLTLRGVVAEGEGFADPVR